MYVHMWSHAGFCVYVLNVLDVVNSLTVSSQCPEGMLSLGLEMDIVLAPFENGAAIPHGVMAPPDVS